MKNLITILITNLFSLALYSNNSSTDVVRFYVLFDISGSIDFQDDNKNLQALTDVLLKIDNNISKTPVSIDFIAFGDTIQYESLDLYQADGIEKARDNFQDYVHNLYSKYIDSRSEKYTDIYKALKHVEHLSSTKRKEETSGVFIITDGQLQSKDINSDSFSGTYGDYLEGIKTSIKKIEQARIPVFLIQTSRLHINPYFDLPRNSGIDTLLVYPSAFWISNNCKYGVTKDQATTDAFNNFIRSAKYLILNSRITDFENDPVGKMIVLSQYLNLLDTLNKAVFLGTKEFENQLDSIKNFLDGKFELEGSKNNSQNADPKDIEGNTFIKSPSNFSQNTNLYASRNPLELYQEPSNNDPQLSKILDEINQILDAALRNGLVGDELALIQSKLDSVLNTVDFVRLARFLREGLDDIAINTILVEKQLLTSAPIDQIQPSIEEGSQLNKEEHIIIGLSDYLIKRVKLEALITFYEAVNDNVFDRKPYLKDTLFLQTSSILDYYTSTNKESYKPDLLLIKEAFQDDINRIPENLILHPRVRSSNGLIAMLYGTAMITSLSKGMSLEKSFESILELRSDQIIAAPPVERGFLFVSHLITFLNNHNLASFYDLNKPEHLIKISQLFAVHISNKYPEIHEIKDIDDLSKKIKVIYQNYLFVRSTIETINQEIQSLRPTASFQEYSEYKRQLTLRILNNCTDLLISGVELAQHFTNSNNGEITESIGKLRNQAKTAVDSWFLIQNQEYTKAISRLLPMIPNMPSEFIEHYEKIDSVYKNIPVKSNLDRLRDDKRRLIVIADSLRNTNQLDTLFSTRELALKYLEVNQLDFIGKILITENESGRYKVKLPYGIVLDDLIDFYEEVIDKSNYRRIKAKKLDNRLKNWNEEQNLKNIQAQVGPLMASYFSVDGLDDNVKKLISIGADVSNAQTAGDIEKTIEKYALPPASYRNKRAEPSKWHINTYVGAGASYYLEDDQIYATIQAPVGLEYSNWFKRKEKRNTKMSWSVFLPLIDVGNVINYQVNDIINDLGDIGDPDSDTDVDDRNFKFENVVSPGIAFIIGLSKKHPLALGVGYQSFPHRVNLFASFDLPLFRLN